MFDVIDRQGVCGPFPHQRAETINKFDSPFYLEVNDMQSKRYLNVLLFSAVVSNTAIAEVVTPASYTFDQATQCGSWCYHDSSFTKLTDGIVGNAGWAVNQGQEWAGWTENNVNIDFSFGKTVNISSISVGSTQDNLFDVVLPSLKVYQSDNGTSWSFVQALNIPRSDTNNNNYLSTSPHGYLTLDNLGIHSSNVRLEAINYAPLGEGSWTFIDEVTFAAPVPEPEEWAMMLVGASMIGFQVKRKKSNYRMG